MGTGRFDYFDFQDTLLRMMGSELFGSFFCTCNFSFLVRPSCCFYMRCGFCTPGKRKENTTAFLVGSLMQGKNYSIRMCLLARSIVENAFVKPAQRNKHGGGGTTTTNKSILNPDIQCLRRDILHIYLLRRVCDINTGTPTSDGNNSTQIAFHLIVNWAQIILKAKLVIMLGS